jgi:hypothetical protein
MNAKKVLLTLILMTSMGTTSAVNGLESLKNSLENLPQNLNKKSIAFGTAAMSAALAGILFSIPKIRREVIAFAKNPTQYKARLQERNLNGATILLPVTTLAAIAASLIAAGYGALVKDDKTTEQGVHTESTEEEEEEETAETARLATEEAERATAAAKAARLAAKKQTEEKASLSRKALTAAAKQSARELAHKQGPAKRAEREAQRAAAQAQEQKAKEKIEKKRTERRKAIETKQKQIITDAIDLVLIGFNTQNKTYITSLLGPLEYLTRASVLDRQKSIDQNMRLSNAKQMKKHMQKALEILSKLEVELLY